MTLSMEGIDVCTNSCDSISELSHLHLCSYIFWCFVGVFRYHVTRPLATMNN